MPRSYTDEKSGAESPNITEVKFCWGLNHPITQYSQYPLLMTTNMSPYDNGAISAQTLYPRICVLHISTSCSTKHILYTIYTLHIPVWISLSICNWDPATYTRTKCPTKVTQQPILYLYSSYMYLQYTLIIVAHIAQQYFCVKHNWQSSASPARRSWPVRPQCLFLRSPTQYIREEILQPTKRSQHTHTHFPISLHRLSVVKLYHTHFLSLSLIIWPPYYLN